MAIIALGIVPISMLFSKLLLDKMRVHNQKMKKVSSEVMSFQNSAFSSLMYIKVFNLTDLFSKWFKNSQRKYEKEQLEYNKFSIMTSAAMSALGLIVSYSCFGWGAFRLWQGVITYGTMTLFLQMASTLSSSFSGLVGTIPTIISTVVSAGRIMSIGQLSIEKSSDTENVKKVKDNLSDKGLSVVFEDVDFQFIDGFTHVLKNVNFNVNSGEVVALVGSSGGGKTTILSILLGIIYPTKGKAYIKDEFENRAEISVATRCFFSYVPQKNTLFEGSIADNLRMIKPDASDSEIIEVLKIACAYDFIEELPHGIYSLIGEIETGFSIGQSQRISIARALLCNAPIMLLDEATSALDINTERNVLENIMNCGRIKTCIITTHRPSVLKMCQQKYFVGDGAVSLITDEQLSNYYDFKAL